jgi:hypothetical protein
MPGVLPVDDPDPLRAAQEVAGEQVVVAGDRVVLRSGERRLDPAGLLVCLVVGLGNLAATRGRRLPVLLDDPEGVEAGRQVRPGVVELPELADHGAHRLRLAQVLRGHLLALHELGDQAGRVVELGDDPRCNTDCSGVLVRLSLGAPVDPEQRGVLAGNPDDVAVTAQGYQVIAICDAAFERPRLALRFAQVGRQTLDDPS